MELTFDTKGNDKQKDCVRAWLDDDVIEIAYGGAKGSAKSFTGCSLIFGDALMYPGTHYFIARKKLKDIINHTIPSIHEVFQKWGIHEGYYNFNGAYNKFELYNKSIVFLIDGKFLPSDPEYTRFGSMQMTRGWIEEAGEFEEKAKSNLQASIGRWKNDEYELVGKLLQTCNPAKNYLYRQYYKPFTEGTLPSHKRFIQALPTDNKMLPKGYVDNLYKILDSNEIERLIKGRWEFDDNPNAMYNYSSILNMFTNEFVATAPQKYLSADIAYEGSDVFVIGIWQGLVLQDIIAIPKCSEIIVAKKIHEARLKYGIPISNVVYDADGLKTFVRLEAQEGSLKGAVAFHNNGKALFEENYYNIKAQCAFKMAELCKTNQIYIQTDKFREQIIQETEQIRKLHRADDKDPLRLEKKDDLKERLGRSPDFWDMINMRMYFELKPKSNPNKSWMSGLR